MSDELVATHRPTLTMTEAVSRTGVSRSTIQRALKRGDIAGAVREDPDDPMSAWVIPIEGLIAAGWTPDAPGPSLADEQEQVIDLTDSSGPAAPALEIADALHRAELAEQRAEAAERMAAERADRIADLQKALEAQGELIASTQRVLEASTVSGPLIGPTAPDHVAATDTPDQVSTVDTAKPKGKLRRWLFNES